VNAIITTILVAGVVVASTTCVSAQTLPDCGGKYEIIRVNSLKPGKLDAFRKAVHDHQAWYAAHGYKDRVLLGRVFSQEGGVPMFSDAIALTIHTDTLDPTGPAPHAADDAAWNAYVEEYRDASTVVNTITACVADH
jgi:hypothetical protein